LCDLGGAQERARPWSYKFRCRAFL